MGKGVMLEDVMGKGVRVGGCCGEGGGEGLEEVIGKWGKGWGEVMGKWGNGWKRLWGKG